MISQSWISFQYLELFYSLPKSCISWISSQEVQKFSWFFFFPRSWKFLQNLAHLAKNNCQDLDQKFQKSKIFFGKKAKTSSTALLCTETKWPARGLQKKKAINLQTNRAYSSCFNQKRDHLWTKNSVQPNTLLQLEINKNSYLQWKVKLVLRIATLNRNPIMSCWFFDKKWRKQSL